ncbi:40046_t:CDS:1, partial [Gigaspora margarita]
MKIWQKFHLGLMQKTFTVVTLTLIISQLTRDIEDLKHLLEYFCSLKKVNINYTAFKDLLKKYGCSSAWEKPSKSLLKGILQRHVIDMVIENANKYLKIDDENEQFLETNENEKEQPLEPILISTTKKLLKYIHLFSTNRIGNDEVTKSAPMKLRQLVYSVLENRGFSEILNEGEHPFIIALRDFVVYNLNQYRTIKDLQKHEEIKSTATELI